DRAGDPGRRARARLYGRRHRGDRVRLQLPGHRHRAGRRRAQPRHADRAVRGDADRGAVRAAQPRRRPRDDPRDPEAAHAVTAVTATEIVEVGVDRRPGLAVVRRALVSPRGIVGLTIVGALVAIAVLGPLVAPHSPTEFVGAPNSQPAAGYPL